MPESKPSGKTERSAIKVSNQMGAYTVFNHWLLALACGKEDRKVIVYYGIGGINKSGLRAELMAYVERRNGKIDGKTVNAHFAGIDLNEYNSPAAVLLDLRKQIEYPCVLFDYGLIRYLSSTGKTLDQIREFIPENSIFGNIIGDILEATHIPAELIDQISFMLGKEYSTQSGEYHDEIGAIDACKREPADILGKLPHLLGTDISIISRSKDLIFAIFLNSYESIYQKQDFELLKSDPEKFIQELILSSGRTLFIIENTEYLKWGQKDPVWNELLVQHIYGYLTDQNADYFLKSVPILDGAIRKSIITCSKGIPLYMDLCVEIYSKNKDKNITAYDFIIPQNEIIPRFLSYLSDDERTLLTALSYLHFFNLDMFEILVKELNIPHGLSTFEEIIEQAFVLSVRKIDGVYRIHDDFYDYVINNSIINGKSRIVSKIFSGMINYLNDNKHSIFRNAMEVLYPGVTNLLLYMPEQNTRNGEKFLELSIFLIDSGYWNIVGNISALLFKKYPEDDRIKLLLAAYLRRFGLLKSSIKILEDTNPENPLLGSYKDYIAYYRADTLRVMGRFSKALPLFQTISKKYENNKNGELYLKSQNQIGDLTFMFGKFSDAMATLKSAYGERNRNSVLFAERLRIEGHIYRFNFMFEDAIERYFNAMELARKFNNLGLEAKLYNNLAEAYCWFDPEKAVEYGQESLVINHYLSSPMEYGKTYASLSIANSMKGDFASSLKYSDLALATQEKIKYPGGIVYAHGSYCLVYLKTGNTDKFMEHYNKMKKLVSNIGAIEYIMLPYYIYFNAPELNDMEKNFQWLHYGKTVKNIKEMLKM